MNPIVQFSGQFIDIREIRNISEVAERDDRTYGFTIYFKGVEAPFNINYAFNDVPADEFKERVNTIRVTLANMWAQYWGQYEDAVSRRDTIDPVEEAGADAMDVERLIREDDEAIDTLMGSKDD